MQRERGKRAAEQKKNGKWNLGYYENSYLFKKIFTVFCCRYELFSKSNPYLNLNVSHFCCWANDGPPNQSREDVLGEIRACIAALDKLKREIRKPEEKKKELSALVQWDIVSRIFRNNNTSIWSLMSGTNRSRLDRGHGAPVQSLNADW